MIDWNNKPEGAQRHGENLICNWLKREGDVISFYDGKWVVYTSKIKGVNDWNNATTDPRIAPTPTPLQLTWEASPINATHILQHRESSNQVFVIRHSNGGFKDLRKPFALYNKNKWFVVSERPSNTVTVDSTIDERGERYGKFNEGADIMQTLKTVMRETDGWERLTSSQREALEMIQHKIGRVLNGDPTYDDNWRDICGYSQLILDELNGNKR
tara:strand:+ start:713 stop:1354 length:642 start_codon:yes stop_codon:yes gene_type:complete